MEKKQILTLCACLIAIVLLLVFGLGKDIRVMFTEWKNDVDHAVQKADDATNYETRKKVEDTCRAMQASYQADKLTWEQYRNSDSEEQRSWADQALLRANRTAATYNTYILENSYVWEDNVPKDIDKELPYLKPEE